MPTAEALKYACNAFHAVKITFANEMGRVFSPVRRGLPRGDGDLLRGPQAQHLAGLPAPGFAFGGSCLPKDLRALQHLARPMAVDLPLISATTVSNELVVRHVVDRVLASGHRRVCLLGLSFKMNTDDLRESPSLELAERLVGKGLEVRIYDPIVNPDRLVGANLRHLQSKLAHVNRLLGRHARRTRWRAPRSSSWRPPTRRSLGRAGEAEPQRVVFDTQRSAGRPRRDVCRVRGSQLVSRIRGTRHAVRAS